MTNRAGKLLVVLAMFTVLVLGSFLSGTVGPSLVRAQEPLRVAGQQFENAEAFVRSGRRCDTPIPTENQVRRARLAAESVRSLAGVEDALSPTSEVVIKVSFHVIHASDEGKVTQGQIDKQIEVLNMAYRGSGFQFQLNEVDYTDVAGDAQREGWFTMAHLGEDEREAKRTLGKDPESQLNIYTANLGDSLLGWATFPSDLAGDKERDGVVLLYTSLPADEGSPHPMNWPFGLGHTGTHEVGHWLGLYHTFQDGCFPPGDEVDDTPPHQTNVGCPSATTDTCTGDKDPSNSTKPWTDPIKNYMNYTDDACMSELTPRQIRRMREQTVAFRPRLFDVSADARERIMNAARAAGRGP